MYQNFERIRNDQGFTNYQVSKATGISQSVLSNWKSGNSNPNLHNITQIALFLGVTVDELINKEPGTA